ncbi:MAG: hypothetical protein ACRDUW_05855, partial [Pseudonocardiaceae bacterium]
GGLGYLQKVYPADNARSVMQLVTVLFHLVVLGLLALISTLDVATGMPIRDLVVKWGVVLLGLAAAHGLTMAILVGMRSRRREERLEDEMAGEQTGTGPRDATVYPVADIETRSGRSSYPA